MVASVALALALQAPTNIPKDAEVIYALMPRLVPVGNPNGSSVSLSQSIHAVTATIVDTPATEDHKGKSEVLFETLSLYKNTANVECTVQVVVAFEAWRSGFGEAIKVDALWSDAAVTHTGPVRTIPTVPEKGQIGTYAYTFNLPVKKLATHSLRLRYRLPIGVSGVDREERLVAYRLANVGQAPLEQFRMSVKYTPEIVFTPIEAKPDWGWQVGDSGAYLKLDGKPSDRDAVLTFRYYPPSF